MSKLIITRGLPGSGKSTAARAWVLEDPDNRAEVNRDWLRLMVGGFTVGSSAQESMITKLSHNGIRDLLKSGKDVVSSDTNLPSKYVRELQKIAISVGAEVIIWDFTDVPLEICIARNNARTDKSPVPVSVIRRMYVQYVDGKGYPLPVPNLDSAGRAPDLYVPKLGTPRAFICDIDGTALKMKGRSPYDYTRVSTDIANRPVVRAIQAYAATGAIPLFVSGRPDIHDGQVRRDTLASLHEHVRVPFKDEHLFMRPGDRLQENDALVKRDLFDANIRDHFDVEIVFDDRDRVVRMWREELGLPTMQVAYGDF